MAIAFSQSATKDHWTGVGVTSETVSFTGASGDTLLLVMVSTNQAQNVTGMTYDGNAMTLISSLSPGSNNKQWLYGYGGAIATSAKNIVISFSASILYFNVAAITLSGSKTSVSGLNVGTNFSNSIVTTASNSITTTKNDSFVIDSFSFGSDGGVVSSTWSSTNGASVRSGMSAQLWYKSVPTAGAQTPSYGMTSGQNYSLISVEIETGTKTITLTEAGTNTDTVSRVGSFVRTLTENGANTDTTFATKVTSLNKSESIVLSDTVSKAFTALRSLIETVSFVENTERVLGFIRTLTENGTFTASTLTIRVAPLTIVETSTLIDQVLSTSTFIRSLTDTAYVSDLSVILSGIWIPRIKPVSAWTQRIKPPTTWT